MLCRSLIKIQKHANHMKNQNKNHQNTKSIGKKLKTKGLIFFVSFFSCDLQDFKYQYVDHKHLGQASCTKFTLP